MAGGRNNKTFALALSAISTAVAVAGLIFGFFVPYMLATGYLIAVVALMVPLSKQFFVGDALAYLATCILTVVLGATIKIWNLVPFIMFFGLHPLVNALQIRFKINRWIALVVKAIWFDLTLWVGFILIFTVTGGTSWYDEVVRFIDKYLPFVIIFGGTLIFWLYDYLVFKCQIYINELVYRVAKR